MVSGAAALLLQEQPSLTPDQVKARLMKTATKNFPSTSVAVDAVTGISYTSTYDLFTVGAGYLDVWAALNNTDVASGPALSPTASQLHHGITSVVITPVRCGRTLRLGHGIVWGGKVIANDSHYLGNSHDLGNEHHQRVRDDLGHERGVGHNQPFPQTVSIHGDQYWSSSNTEEMISKCR
jgi:serine protease AprX